MRFWLVKTEKSTYSIDDFKRDRVTHWHGVRNYQARNFLNDMRVGDKVLFYHSVDEPIGLAGMAEVVKTAYPDPSQYDKKSEYYDAKSSRDKPRWFCPDFKYIGKFKKIIPLSDLKMEKVLSGMELLKRGSRLSVQPVTRTEYEHIMKITGE